MSRFCKYKRHYVEFVSGYFKYPKAVLMKMSVKQLQKLKYLTELKHRGIAT